LRCRIDLPPWIFADHFFARAEIWNPDHGVKRFIIENVIPEGPDELIGTVGTELFFVIIGKGIPEWTGPQSGRRTKKES
jgi:hypothetical protein